MHHNKQIPEIAATIRDKDFAPLPVRQGSITERDELVSRALDDGLQLGMLLGGKSLQPYDSLISYTWLKNKA
jgi:hypothetical protein